MRLLKFFIYTLLLFIYPLISNAQVTNQKFSLLDKTKIADNHSSKSPKGAMIRSLILPGWGQVYNGKYIKALVFLGGESYFISQYLKLNDELKILEDTPGVIPSVVEDKEQQRNGWGWLFGAGYLLAMGDAFVDAHLDEVSIDESFSVNIRGNKQNNGLSMQLQFNF